MNDQLSWPNAIRKVLDEADEPMSAAEIAHEVVARGLRHEVGATPHATVGSKLSTLIRRDGASSPFVRVSHGRYAARRRLGELTAAPIIDAEEAVAGGIQALGMYWHRDDVQWSANVRLMGQQTAAADPVDVASQIGIYLLHDRRDVVYVGRSTHGSIGTRLLEHTRDRHRGRWDRFSWFGLCPIRSDGSIDPHVPDIGPDAMIAALEAVLIEALEPPQNRKRGDELAAVEFIQYLDPALASERAAAQLLRVARRS